MGASTLVGHSSLITKVYFPRELLPLSMTAANLVNMGIAYAIFLPYAIYVRGFSMPALLLLIPITRRVLRVHRRRSRCCSRPRWCTSATSSS